MARMPLQADDFAAVYCVARDTGKPENEAHMRHLVDARTFVPPSKGKLKRHARHAAGSVFMDKARAYPEPSAETLQLRAQLAFLKSVIADMGGSRTIAPSAEGQSYIDRNRDYIRHVEPSRCAEQTPTSFAEHMALEQRKCDALREKLARETERAKEEASRKLGREHQLPLL